MGQLDDWGENELSDELACEVLRLGDERHMTCIEAILEKTGQILFTGEESPGPPEMTEHGYTFDYLRGIIGASSIENFVREDGMDLVQFMESASQGRATLGMIEGFFRQRVFDALGGEDDVFLDQDLERKKAERYLSGALQGEQKPG